jgi:branched-chain amino acid transport system substrate-binding protein
VVPRTNKLIYQAIKEKRRKEEEMNWTMKKVFFCSLVAGFLVFQGFVDGHFASFASDEVSVGVILPMSGPIAPIGRTCKRGLDFAAKELNSEGGIKSLKGAKIKLIYADSRGDPKIGASEAERLIVKDNVSVIMGSYQSSVTLTSTQVAERYKVPYVSLIAVADPITQRGFKYVFRVGETTDLLSKDIMKFFSEMGKQTGKPVKTVGLLYENTDFGQSSAKNWKRDAKEYGFDVILDEAYPHGTTDISPVILKFKNANPDAVLNVSYVSDIILIVKSIAENKWTPKVFYAAGGVENEPEFVRSVIDLAEYHFNVIPYSPDLLLVKPWARPIADGFEKEYGVGLSAESVWSYTTFNVLVDALERAASTDREKIRDALAKTNITKGKALLLPYNRIEFGPDGQNPHARVMVSQWQKGKLRIVYPSDVTPPGIKAIWPAIPWEQRK